MVIMLFAKLLNNGTHFCQNLLKFIWIILLNAWDIWPGFQLQLIRSLISLFWTYCLSLLLVSSGFGICWSFSANHCCSISQVSGCFIAATFSTRHGFCLRIFGRICSCILAKTRWWPVQHSAPLMQGVSQYAVMSAWLPYDDVVD